MKRISILTIGAAVLGSLLATQEVRAGNPDRTGQAGATQLVVNPWARSSGWGGVNMAGVSGVEAMNFNIAGTSNTRGTEFAFAHSQWLGGVGVGINTFGFATKLGGRDSGRHTLSLSIMSFDFGDIQTTTENSPEGIGSYTPQFMNIAVGYSYTFSRNISGGLLMRTLTEGIPNAKASGISLDAGIQYKAGKADRTRFGVALRNVGPSLKYSGDGLSTRGLIEGYDYSMTLERRSSNFEMPSVLNVSMSYDLIVDTTGSGNGLTAAAAFTSNAFSKDQFGAGLQYTWNRYLQVRAGYVYEQGLYDKANNTSAYSGPSAGISVNVPFGLNKERLKKTGEKDYLRNFGLDYSFRASGTFSGTHTFGIRLTI